jgi:hypothetical protein
MAAAIPDPPSFFGFRPGSERNIARWDKIVDYFYLLNQTSDRIRVVNLGPSTEENPFLLAIITSADNLANLDELREINAQIADPRGLSEEKIDQLVAKGKVVVCQSMSLHASEISATQMAPELAYDLVTGEDETTRSILENTIFLMVPCFNPDGQLMVTDWYNEHVGTEYEGAAMPWLYHRYCGHDNNRDAFMLNLIESRYMAKIMFEDWHPQIFQDHHEMGTYGPRLYISPYCEPLHPHGDPLIWRELNWYGAHMAYKLEEAGHQGVITGAIFPAWSHMGFHWLGNYHNIASMLTESAHARLATPIYIHPHQLKGEDGSTLHGLPEYKAQTNFPNPWPGGRWSVRDMIDQQLVTAKGVMDLAAQYRETVLRNAVHKALRQTKRGEEDASAGFFIRPDQHDTLTATTLINTMLRQGVDMHRTSSDLTLGDTVYPAGTYFIPVAQPKRGVVKTLLERTSWPDDAWTRHEDGSPSRPYDTVTDTMAEMMGVRVEPVPVSHADLVAHQSDFMPMTESIPMPGGIVGDFKHSVAVDPRHNAGYRAINRLLDAGATFSRSSRSISAAGHDMPPGAFVFNNPDQVQIEAVVRETGVPFYALEYPSTYNTVMRPRIAMYQRYWGGNMDEGWTRLTLEQFGFPYQTVRDEDLKKDMHTAYDTLILPDDTTDMMVGGEDPIKRRLQNMPVPEKYRSGFGESGVEAINAFVENGGTLIAINKACQFAIDKLGLQVTNTVANLPTKAFYCPGSMLRVRINTSHALAYGMPDQALIMHWNSPVFSVNPSYYNDQYEILASYPEKDVLESGWLIGEDHLVGRPAMLAVKHGKGRVVLYGFHVQFRTQMHGTFKLLFNALYGV